MGLQRCATMLLFAYAVVGCGTIGNTPVPQPTRAVATATPTLPIAAPTATMQREPLMPKDVQSGPIPNNLDSRLAYRDTEPLPSAALIRFQSINRGKNQTSNYRWVLYPDGRWFLAANSGADLAKNTLFDTEIPTKPTATLPADLVAQIHKALLDAKFATLPPYFVNPTVDDGGYDVITARIDGSVHEIIYEAYQPPFVELLADVVTKYR